MNPEQPNTPLSFHNSGPPPGPVQVSSNFTFFKLIRMNTILLIGMGFFLAAAFFACLAHLWLSKAQFTNGEIVEMIAVRGTKSTTYKPRVRYTTMDGQEREFVRSYSSSPPEFKTGEKVTVGHNPETGEGRIVTFGQRFGLAWILAWIGLSLTTLSIGFTIGRQIIPRIYLH